MKNIHHLLLCVFFLLSIPAIAQGPERSPKLEKEQGFNILKINAKLSAVKSVLKKDTIAKTSSWDYQPENMDGITEIYLVDLTKPGYSKFLGRDIARIEVYISPYFSDDESPVVWEVKLFFKKTSNEDVSAFFTKMFDAYGGAYPVVDTPRKGDTIIGWYSGNVMMNAVSFCGPENNPKDEYFKVEFLSAKGG